MLRILLVTPPFTQFNTPYPATPYVTRYLRSNGHNVDQLDLSIETACTIFSKSFLSRAITQIEASHPDSLLVKEKSSYLHTVDQVLKFLQGKDDTIAHRIVSRDFLPEGKMFHNIRDDEHHSTFDTLDRAKYFSTLYLEDIALELQNTIDPDFGLIRYSESLGLSQHSFEPIAKRIKKAPTLIETAYTEILHKKLLAANYDVVGFTIPFPGNLVSSIRCAQLIKDTFPNILTLAGGGFVTTELHSLKDISLFSFFDYLIFNDGEEALQMLLKELSTDRKLPASTTLVDTAYFDKETNKVCFSRPSEADTKEHACFWPDYKGLTLSNYFSLFDSANPMMRLWSDGRWNKMTLAHGCYWHKCSFCDTSLPYIRDYKPYKAEIIADRMQELIEETGISGFHFVDEAAPPALLKELSLILLQRGISCSYWTNIRFEKNFTPDLCKLLAKSGCIAVSGGLEVASQRVLKLVNKGVTLEDAISVSHNFSQAGVLVHAYLMYGFPTQTAQETVDSLEVVRQMFLHNCIDSGYWHQFVLTCHSLIFKEPEKYSVKAKPCNSSFALNDIVHTDNTNIDHNIFSNGLKNSLQRYMLGQKLEKAVESWFDFATPKAQLSNSYVQDTLERYYALHFQKLDSCSTILMLKKVKVNRRKKKASLQCSLYGEEYSLSCPLADADFIDDLQSRYDLYEKIEVLLVKEILARYRLDFSSFFQSETGSFLRELSLVLL